MLKKFILLLSFITLTLHAKEIQVVFSYTTPPFVFKSGKGIVIDIVRESLAYKSHKIKPIFVNLGRSLEMFKNGYVDATSLIKKSSGLKAYYSDVFMQYHNMVISLQSNKIHLNSLSDLRYYYSISFQNAAMYLGKDFAEVAREAGDKYSEIADQKLQVYKLLMGRTDFIVMDKSIFEYYKNELVYEKRVPKGIKINFFNFLKPTKFRTAFRDKKIRDDFDLGLKHLRKTGQYNAIYKKYSKKYFKIEK